MSLTLKIGTLVIRTLAKPIANYIKSTAREHESFKRFCIDCAQRVHRLDMRLRLGLIPGRNYSTAPKPARAEAGEGGAGPAGSGGTGAASSAAAPARPRIRPLSEAKAIETGANFISESFMFVVAGSIIVFEAVRSRRKESLRREDVGARLDALEAERERLLAMVAELERELAGIGGGPAPVGTAGLAPVTGAALHRVLLHAARASAAELEKADGREEKAVSVWAEAVGRLRERLFGGEGAEGKKEPEKPDGKPDEKGEERPAGS